MSSSNGFLSALAQIATAVLDSVRSSRKQQAPRRPDARLRGPAPDDGEADAGRERGSETIRLDPDLLDDVRIEYAPDRDGAPDAGEVVWTWVPYEENDGRGKDRPLLVIGRQSGTRVYAVRMTSKAHDGDRDYISIGSGAWDAQGRPSWVDIEQLYSVHENGLRREAAALDRDRFSRVASALVQRYRWAA